MEEFSKSLLILIEALGLGALGLDRLYMNCPGTAALKLLAFIVGVVAYYIDEFIGSFFLLIWFIWAFFDYILVFINALLQSPSSPFCKANITWSDNGFAVWLVLLIILLDFVAASFGVYAFGPFAIVN